MSHPGTHGEVVPAPESRAGDPVPGGSEPARGAEVSVFGPGNYFDLSRFCWREIFAGAREVWAPLRRIEAFILAAAARQSPVGEGSEVRPGAILVGGPIVLGKDCVVEEGAYLRGPLLLGDRVRVRHGAYLRGNVVAGADCVIGHSTEVKNSIFLDGSKAPHFAYVGDSILGNRVNLGAGTKVSNLKVVAGNITVRTREGVVDTGLRKLGGILGDEVQTGCNSVLNPGTLVGPRSIIYPNCSVSGLIASDTLVKLRQTVEMVARDPKGRI